MPPLSRPPWEFLSTVSDASVESFLLSRLNHANNLRQEIMALLDQWIEENSSAMLAGWVLQHRLDMRRAGGQTAPPASLADDMFAGAGPALRATADAAQAPAHASAVEPAPALHAPPAPHGAEQTPPAFASAPCSVSSPSPELSARQARHAASASDSTPRVPANTPLDLRDHSGTRHESPPFAIAPCSISSASLEQGTQRSCHTVCASGPTAGVPANTPLDLRDHSGTRHASPPFAIASPQPPPTSSPASRECRSP